MRGRAVSAPEPDPWAEGSYGPSADPLPPDLADSMASWAATPAHDCPGPECHAYPTFDDHPARWGFLPEPEMTEAELAAAALAEAWGGQEPSASYAAWVAEGQAPEPEAEP